MTGTGSGSDDDTAPLSDDEAIRVLASDTRRATVRVLQDDPTRSLDDLAAAVAGDDRASPDSSDRLRTRLHHCHLPKLDTAGVLRYDTDDLCVDYLGDEAVETVLSSLER